MNWKTVGKCRKNVTLFLWTESSFQVYCPSLFCHICRCIPLLWERIATLKEIPVFYINPYKTHVLRDSFHLLNPHCVLCKTIIIRPMLQKFTTHWHSLLHSIKALNWCISAIPKTSALLINPKTIFIPTYHLLLCCDLIFWQLKVFSGKLDTDLVRLSSSLP